MHRVEEEEYTVTGKIQVKLLRNALGSLRSASAISYIFNIFHIFIGVMV